MVTKNTSYNSSIVCWRKNGEVIEVLVLDSLPTNPKYLGPLQVKFPGGGGKHGETPVGTALRELLHETGIRVRGQSLVEPIYVPEPDKGHQKYGFLVSWTDCEGQLAQAPKRERDSLISNRRFIPIDEALRIVHQPEYNQFQLNLAQNAKLTIEEKFLAKTL